MKTDQSQNPVPHSRTPIKFEKLIRNKKKPAPTTGLRDAEDDFVFSVANGVHSICVCENRFLKREKSPNTASFEIRLVESGVNTWKPVSVAREISLP